MEKYFNLETFINNLRINKLFNFDSNIIYDKATVNSDNKLYILHMKQEDIYHIFYYDSFIFKTKDISVSISKLLDIIFGCIDEESSSQKNNAFPLNYYYLNN